PTLSTMRFNFSALTAIATLALTTVPTIAQPECGEAQRFGALTVTPTTLFAGDTFTAHVDLSCAAGLGFLPTFMDYYIETSSGNNGSVNAAPLFLARHTFTPTPNQFSTDTLTTELPPWFYFEGAKYSVVFRNSFEQKGPENNSVILVGETSAPILIVEPRETRRTPGKPTNPKDF
ncbi:hypothetical protein DFH06DRAFT_1012148, partial [Mycena polygramma]